MSKPDSFCLPERLLGDMITRARQGYPNEICGLIAGIGRQARELRPMRNVAWESRVRYAPDPAEQWQAFQEIERKGWELVGIYHSHPRGPAYPSEVDIAEAHYPGVAYLIVSLKDQQSPEVTAWAIKDGRTDAITLEIV